MNFKLTTVLLLFVSSLLAQTEGSLIVQYNLYSNDVSYIQNGQRIAKPSVKKGENIYVELTEYNP